MVEAVKNLRQAVCCISLSQYVAFGLWPLTYAATICQYLNPETDGNERNSVKHALA